MKQTFEIFSVFFFSVYFLISHFTIKIMTQFNAAKARFLGIREEVAL